MQIEKASCLQVNQGHGLEISEGNHKDSKNQPGVNDEARAVLKNEMELKVAQQPIQSITYQKIEKYAFDETD